MKHLALILLLLTGCAGRQRHFVVAAQPDAYANTLAAAAQWRMCGETTIDVYAEPHEADAHMVHVDFISPGIIGLWRAKEHEIWYVNNDPVLFAHEMGHMQGEDHAKHGVMRAAPEYGVDLAACDRLRADLDL